MPYVASNYFTGPFFLGTVRYRQKITEKLTEDSLLI